LLAFGRDIFEGRKESSAVASADIDKLHTKISKLTLERNFSETTLLKVR